MTVRVLRFSKLYPIINIDIKISSEKNNSSLELKNFVDYFSFLCSFDFELIQIRAKNLEIEIFKSYLDLALSLRERVNTDKKNNNFLEKNSVPKPLLIVNDNFELARELDVDGLHIGQEDLDPKLAREIIGERKILGLSTNSISDVKKANDLDFIDYIGFGPIFGTKTKLDHKPSLGLEKLKEASKISKKPLVAIGGITLADFELVLKSGAKSIATISEMKSIFNALTTNS